MPRDIAATRLIEVFCRQEDALAVIWEIQNIEKTEVKADAVQVNKQTEHTGTYKVRGHFAGIPWHNEFAYVLHEQGFHSTMGCAVETLDRVVSPMEHAKRTA